MAEAVLLALTKIGDALANEIAKELIAKLSEKVNNVKDLDEKIEQMRKQLTTMNNVILQIGTAYLTDEVVKGWIGEVRKVAYRVEDVMDKYSYYSVQMAEEWFLKKYFIKASHYVIVFTEIANEVVKIEKEIKQVIELKDQWLHPSQLVSDPLTEMERQRSRDSFPELVKDEDLVGIEDNRRLLTEWLYTDELDSKVITVSGMGGLGKTTLVTNVYEREKINFSAHAWMVVSQTYTVDALLRKLLWKVGYTEPPLSSNIDKMDVYDLKEEIKRMLKVRKCLIVLDDVWDQEAYFQIRDAFQNDEGSRDENEPLCFEALKPRSTELHRLIIRGQWAKWTLDYPIFRSHGKYLKYLALSWCHLGEDPLGMLASHLSNLTYLRLNNMHSAETLVLDAEAFPYLKTLVLQKMPDVNQIKIMDGALPCIEGLYIVSLPKLNKVPQGIESLSSLKKLWLTSLHKDFKIQWNGNGMHQKTMHVAEIYFM
uniref:NB-ARC domain-containing protein n=1 Tax=Oryza glumipatula TaxID=40148 RepID=A0A0E0BGY6_9ORYZ